MTEFYGLPNAGEFWHWTNALHFVLVGLAGGIALLAALLQLRGHEEARRYTLLALLVIALDLFVLWAESPARFRFTHIWLFLSFRPPSPIWWGAWGLALAFLFSGLLYLEKGPRKLLAWILLLFSLVALSYPGMALAVNENRPLWNALLAGLFPLTALVLGPGGVRPSPKRMGLLPLAPPGGSLPPLGPPLPPHPLSGGPGAPLGGRRPPLRPLPPPGPRGLLAGTPGPLGRASGNGRPQGPVGGGGAVARFWPLGAGAPRESKGGVR